MTTVRARAPWYIVVLLLFHHTFLSSSYKYTSHHSSAQDGSAGAPVPSVHIVARRKCPETCRRAAQAAFRRPRYVSSHVAWMLLMTVQRVG